MVLRMVFGSSRTLPPRVAALVLAALAAMAPMGAARAQDDGQQVDANALYQQANALVPRGRFDEALALYQQVVAAQPSWSDPWFNMGEVCRVAERPDCCVLYFRRYLFLEGGAQAFDYEDVSRTVATCEAAMSGAGHVQVDATPAEALIAIDGVVLGEGTVAPLALPVGPHRVTVTLEDHNDFAADVAIAAGQTGRVTATLDADALFGALVVDAHVAGLQVFVDDALVGVTPLPSPVPVPVGQRLVRLTHPYYHDWLRRIEVIRDEEYFLEPAMERTEESFRDDVP
jgi:tetratricopeptide (TPR) repeat protein